MFTYNRPCSCVTGFLSPFLRLNTQVDGWSAKSLLHCYSSRKKKFTTLAMADEQPKSRTPCMQQEPMSLKYLWINHSRIEVSL